MWGQIKRIIKPGGAIVMTASQPFTTKLISSNMKMFKYCWVWKKSVATGFLNAKKMPLNNYEDIVVFYENQCTYNPQFSYSNPYRTKGRKPHNPKLYNNFINPGKECKDGKRYPLRIQKFDTVNLGTVHPTQKPVALMEYLIKTYTNEGDTVLDFCAGSGTAGCAARLTNRKFIGIELNEEYYKIASKRIKYTPYQKPLNLIINH